MSTSNKKSFIYSPSQQDVDAYIKFKSGESKHKPYMKDYKALHHIEGLSDNSILVYEAIRNLVGMYIVQQKYKESYKNKKLSKLGIGVSRTNNIPNTSVIGTTMIITNPMLQEWIGNKSHNTIKSALEQLESMGFIKCATDGTKKTGRKITLLRDMEEYQPEEIDALEAYINALGNVESTDSVDVLPENENECGELPVKSNSKKFNKSDKKFKIKETESKKTETKKKQSSENSDEDELDDFDF